MPPAKLKAMHVGNTKAVLSWKPIHCRHRNGKITHYLLNHKHSSMNEYLTFENKLEVTLDNLHPNTRYLFKVAGVNRAGTGPFSLPLELVTTGGRKVI